jgi:hypothetical protein
MDATTEVYIQGEIQCIHLCKLRTVEAFTNQTLMSGRARRLSLNSTCFTKSHMIKGAVQLTLVVLLHSPTRLLNLTEYSWPSQLKAETSNLKIA